MATFFFHQETYPAGQGDRVKLVYYYYDDIAAEILMRSFLLYPATADKDFLDNERVPFADLRPDLKQHLIRFLFRRDQAALRAAS